MNLGWIVGFIIGLILGVVIGTDIGVYKATEFRHPLESRACIEVNNIIWCKVNGK